MIEKYRYYIPIVTVLMFGCVTFIYMLHGRMYQ